MSDSDMYKTVSGETIAEYKEKGSRFIAQIFPLKSEEQVKEIVNELRNQHAGANHVCYAFRFGVRNINQRGSDSGEPSGTAGEPILRQLVKNELTNSLLTVVRYFGGTKLGVPGLINAYKTAAESVINKSKIKNEYLYLTVSIKFTYMYMDTVMRLIDQFEVKVTSKEFDENCQFECKVREGKADEFQEKLKAHHEIEVNV